MGVNIKFGDRTLNNVSQLRVADADTAGTYDTFVYGSGANLQSLKVVTISGTGVTTVIPDTGYDAMNQIQINATVDKPTLYAPTISVDPDESTVVVINDSNNGQFANAYEVYKDGVLLVTTSSKQVYLSALISTGGTYAIKVKAISSSQFNNSDYSNTVNVTIVQSYSITPTLENVTADESNPTSIKSGETKTLYYYPAENYNLPDTVTVTGADSTWEIEEI